MARSIYDKNFASKKKKLRQNYGLTFERYMELLELDNFECSICRSTPFDDKGILCVDHNHKTGSVRGVLCVRCNAGLGQFRDNQEFLKSAISYLEKHYDK